jgi:membrane protein implicated in regulation of membrane protease activity
MPGSVEDAIFIACALIGLVLLLVIFVFDDRVAVVLERLKVDLDDESRSRIPAVAGFVALFGAGGLLVETLTDVSAPLAIAAAVVAGLIGAGIARMLYALLNRAEGAPVTMRDLVGRDARVRVAIPAGRFGSIYVNAGGRTQEYSATAASDVPSGARVTITAALGNGVVVAPVEAPITPRL